MSDLPGNGELAVRIGSEEECGSDQPATTGPGEALVFHFRCFSFRAEALTMQDPMHTSDSTHVRLHVGSVTVYK